MGKHHTWNIYLGIFFVAFATLALEVTLTRLLSVTTWYYLAFFAISTAMLGMTAGSVTVYLKPEWFSSEKLAESLAKACLVFSLMTPISMSMLLIIPVPIIQSVMSLVALGVITFFCALPFYFSGIVVSAGLTKSALPIGKLYACDLIGASLGCLLVIFGLELLSAPSLVLLCASIGALSSSFFGIYELKKTLRFSGVIIGVFLFSLVIINSYFNGLRPLVVKGRIDNLEDYYLEKWNSFSRVVVYKGKEVVPSLLSPSPLLPTENIFQYAITIDGEAGTTIREYSTLDDLEHLRYDATNAVYALHPDGEVCVVGVGGGKDIHSAIFFGYKEILGIEVNPVFIDLLKNEFRNFAGIANRDGIRLIADEARSYLSRTNEKCAIIQMSLTDTWAATGAGAYTLSENALYTTDAWKVFFNRLTEDGIFTVSRWYNPENLGETGRILSLAVNTLLELGVPDPSAHIAMLSAGKVATVLVSKSPFSQEDIATLEQLSSELEFNLEIIPGVAPEHKVLRGIVSSKSRQELNNFIENQPINFEPTTDENPYFFNLLRFSQINSALTDVPGILQGNLFATITLVILILVLAVLCILTILIPLAIKTRLEKQSGKSHHTLWSGAVYFSLIGAGFMLLEIALIQRLSVFLSHPIYALGILLFVIILSSGIGSFMSEKLPLERAPWMFIYPTVMALMILFLRSLLPELLSLMTTSPMYQKILVTILTIAPMGILMGFFFPTGMRMVKSIDDADTPWFWALNGIFGVLCSAVAVFVSIYFKISTNYTLAAICYAALLLPIYDIYTRRKRTQIPA